MATIYDTGRTSADLVYLAMEWLEGHTLEKIIRQNAPLDWETVALMLQQITAGLDAAHQCGIVHRDLKPGNIMVVPQARGPMQLKILDFGIAKITSSETGNFVSTAVGTVQYASPEQMLPGNAIDARTDLYALGVMLYEMLTGRLPFQGHSIAETIRQHLLEPPPPLARARADAPPAIAELIEHLLAKRPANRPASAGAAWLRFEEALRARPAPAAPTIIHATAQPAPTPMAVEPEPEPAEADELRACLLPAATWATLAAPVREPRRNTRWFAVIIALALGVVLVAALK